MLIGGRLDSDQVRTKSERRADPFLHRFSKGQNLWSFGNERAVNIDDGRSLRLCQGAALGEDLEAGDPFYGCIGGRKVVPDVGKSQGSQDGIGDGMREDVSIRVSLQALWVGNLDTAQDKRTVVGELVDIISDSNTGLGQWALG